MSCTTNARRPSVGPGGLCASDGESIAIKALGRLEVKSVPCDDPVGFRRDECVAYLKYLSENYGNYPDLVMFLQSDVEEHAYWGYINLVMEAVAAGTTKNIPFIPLNNGSRSWFDFHRTSTAAFC
eukprot:g2965.t1